MVVQTIFISKIIGDYIDPKRYYVDYIAPLVSVAFEQRDRTLHIIITYNL